MQRAPGPDGSSAGGGAMRGGVLGLVGEEGLHTCGVPDAPVLGTGARQEASCRPMASPI